MKIIGLAIVGALAAIIIKKYNPEQGYLLSTAVICAILLITAPLILAVINFCRELAASAGIDGTLIDVLLKALGISVILRIAVGLCNDAKEQGIASALEIGGSVLILYVSLPLFSAVYKLIQSML